MEMVAEAKTLIVNAICDKCKSGVMMRSVDYVLMSNPPQYLHKCNECGNVEYFTKSYPFAKSVPIEEYRKPVGNEVD